MALSKSEENMLNIQHQLRENQQDLTDFLKDMDSWENDVKQKDEDLKKSKNTKESKLPPVRNSLNKKKKRKKIKPNGRSPSHPSEELTGKKRISGYDYRSWDKLDVDKLCEDVDKDRSASSEYETDEEWELERKQQQAVIEKDRGNESFKNGDYTSAIEAYTKGIELDPCNPLLPANRAMALLKQQKFAAAETDCLTALTLDPLYIKAHLRLGSARFEMKKFKEAKEVFEKVLLLEPQNKKAKMEIELIDKELIKEQRVTQTLPTADPDVGLVKAITKPQNERSKKPLRRIVIEEVGFEDDHERQMAISRTIESQGETKKNITRKDEQMFEHFINSDSSKHEHRSATDKGSTANSMPAAHRQKLFDAQHDGNSVNKIVEIEQTVSLDNVKEELKLDLSDESKKQHSKPAESSRSLESVSPRSSDSVSPRSMTVPQTSFQFQADYKNLKNNMENFYQYLKKISPEKYPKLFGESLEPGILLKMLTVYKQHFIPAGEDVFPHLVHLTNVKRFSMTVMFFSYKEQQVIRDIFAHLKDCGKVTSDDLDKLARKYHLT